MAVYKGRDISVFYEGHDERDTSHTLAVLPGGGGGGGGAR